MKTTWKKTVWVENHQKTREKGHKLGITVIYQVPQLCNSIAFKEEIKRAKTRHPYRAPLKCEGGCRVQFVHIAEKKWSELGEKDRVSVGESE